jgi:Protein-tyrosine phosphatase
MSLDLYYYLNWPDHGVPKTSQETCHMLREMHNFVLRNEKIVVHCSAGCGRTGVMVTALRCLITNEEPSDALEKIRKCRRGMVQNQDQYDYIKVLLETFRIDADTTDVNADSKVVNDNVAPSCVKECRSCNEYYSKSMYSKNQWSRSSYSICIECADILVTTKKCSKCNITKSRKDFSTTQRKKRGKACCKTCVTSF